MPGVVKPKKSKNKKQEKDIKLTRNSNKIYNIKLKIKSKYIKLHNWFKPTRNLVRYVQPTELGRLKMLLG